MATIESSIEILPTIIETFVPEIANERLDNSLQQEQIDIIHKPLLNDLNKINAINYIILLESAPQDMQIFTG